MHGKPLDFSKGRLLAANEGIVAAGRDMHPRCVNAVQQAVEEAMAGKL
jgi:3'(2'), 5'-bisphosphate nucleotidase